MKLGLVVHAVGVQKEADRLVDSFYELGPVTKNVELCLVTDDDYGDDDMVRFNPARAKNIGLRRLLPHVDGVVCIDADYIIPPGLFEFLMEPTMQPFHVWVRRRDISEKDAESRDWVKWVRMGVFGDCWGSCNYMSTENWLRMGGWDERTFGWGGDDDLLHIRIGQFGIERRRIDAIPLMHIQHERRLWSTEGQRGSENIKFARQPQQNYLQGEHLAQGLD